jgi:hypothetical protein
MEEFGRRQLLMGAGVGTLAIAAVGLSATPAAASEDHGESGVEGGWLVMHNNPPDTAEIVKTVATFSEGGATSSRDINPPGPAQFGSWKSTGEHGFVSTLWSGDADPTNPNNIFVIKVIVTGTQDDEDRISGAFSFVVFDKDNNQVDSGAGGTFHGTRIKAGA